MNFAGALLRTAIKPRAHLLDPMVHQLRVSPLELNLGGHMDNVRYLKLMSQARNEFFLRTGMAKLALTQRVSLPLAASEMSYRRSLLLGQKFELETRLIGWNEKWFYIKQRMSREDKTVCEGIFRSAFLGKSGVQEPGRLFSEIHGSELASPALPEEPFYSV